MVSEDERAIAYRQQMVNRVTNKKAREKALAGDPAVLKRIKDAWEPLLPSAGWDPVGWTEDEK